jgi:hypothetical protein
LDDAVHEIRFAGMDFQLARDLRWWLLLLIGEEIVEDKHDGMSARYQ